MAIKSLLTLIKLAKRTIDTLRLEISGREAEKKTLEELSQSLAEELEREHALAAQNPLVALSIAAYAAHVKKRQDAIAAEVNRLTQEIDTRMEALQDAFSEQKRYEIVYEQEMVRQKNTVAQREQQELDAIGLRQYSGIEEA